MVLRYSLALLPLCAFLQARYNFLFFAELQVTTAFTNGQAAHPIVPEGFG